MFQSISWAQFIYAALLVVLIYYVIVGLLYYRKEIHERWRRLAASRTPPGSSPAPADDATFTQASELKASIAEVIDIAVNRAWIKQELLMELARRVEPYVALRQTPFEFAINNHIIQQAELRCGIRLEPDDLRVIW